MARWSGPRATGLTSLRASSKSRRKEAARWPSTCPQPSGLYRRSSSKRRAPSGGTADVSDPKLAPAPKRMSPAMLHATSNVRVSCTAGATPLSFRTALRTGGRLQTPVRPTVCSRCPPASGGTQHGYANTAVPLALAADDANRSPQQLLYRNGSIAPLEQRRAARIVHHVHVLRRVVVQCEPRAHLRNQDVSSCVIKICHSPPQFADLCRPQFLVDRPGVMKRPPDRGGTVPPRATHRETAPVTTGEVVFLFHGSDVGAVRLTRIKRNCIATQR